ncbi:MAG: ribose-5-phosphate isomerase [Caldiserica bacterium]|nr:MAG: ribose-5-phosphate isomerase [Caldisericota bacterium]
MRVILASDHRGYGMKEEIKKWLKEKDIEFFDEGCFSEESCDYPDYSIKAAEKVSKGEFDLGLFFCHTGQGMVISANKVKGVRAALVFKSEIGKLSKEHNNANVLCFPAGYIDLDEVKSAILGWIEAEFKEERHKRRIEKIKKYEEITSNKAKG